MGVLQAINKLDAPHFTHVDEILLENLSMRVSIALRHAEVYRAAIMTNERAGALLQMIQSLSQDLGAQSLILTVTMHASWCKPTDVRSSSLMQKSSSSGPSPPTQGRRSEFLRAPALPVNAVCKVSSSLSLTPTRTLGSIRKLIRKQATAPRA